MYAMISFIFRLQPPSLSSRTATIFLLPFSICIALSLCTIAIDSARIEIPPNVTVTGIFGFGDSIIDPGNNNHLKTLIKCNFPPYGKDFKGGVATGRFGNGKIPTDLLVEALGIKQYLPAYLDPNLQPEDLQTGVSFASRGSGYDPLTPKLVSVISLTEQLDMLKECIEKLKSMVGKERTNFILTNAIYVVVAGSDDIANTYFTTPFRRAEYDIDSYTDLLINSASSFVKELYELGAWRIAVFSAPLIGCVPAQRTLRGGALRHCAKNTNQAAQLFNSKLSDLLDSLNNQLPNSTVVYIDVYNPMLDLIVNPEKYGFEVVDKGCCGTGLIEVVLLCNKLSLVCPDDTKYVFWDSYHPTEKVYDILIDRIVQKYVNRFF
ncbi:hypothetical protein Ancab_016770 [Ancistrocladus abbreviatus]